MSEGYEALDTRHASPLRVQISVPVSPSNAVECYPCRRVPKNYSDSFLFHGGDTGSTPVRDAKFPKHLQDPTEYLVVDAFASGLFSTCAAADPFFWAIFVLTRDPN
jgi:hypothetical protein